MKILSQSGPGPIQGAGVTKSRLQQILQIQQSAGSDAERRAMLKLIQEQIAGEQLQQLAAHIPKVKVSTEQSQEEITNEDGDTLIISDAARQQYETSADTTSSSSSESSGGSSASNATAE